MSNSGKVQFADAGSSIRGASANISNEDHLGLLTSASGRLSNEGGRASGGVPTVPGKKCARSVSQISRSAFSKFSSVY